MRTRCPECGTVFRVTSEQLRLKAGKVRCGHCQTVFNAFDSLQTEIEETLVAVPVMISHEIEPAAEPDFPVEELAEAPDTAPSPKVGTESALAMPEVVAPDAPTVPLAENLDATLLAAEPFDATLVVASPEAVVAVAEVDLPQPTPVEMRVETPEDSAQMAREAGLVAARELSETPAYNRWAAGALAGNDLGGFAAESAKRIVWPFILVAVLLLIALAGQLLYYFRTEVVLRIPGMADLYATAAVDVPLPRNSALVSIEASDLQADHARGLFVLQATLKNQATYTQAWPALELSLTDTNDAVLARRVLHAADYLPPGTKAEAFPANGEVAVRLWIEARNVGAAGYRLYIFYP